DFDDLDDDLENVVEEPSNAATTGVSTASAPVTTVGVAISTAEPKTPPTTTTIFDDEDVILAMAQTLINMNEQKAKEKGVAITDVEDSSRTVRPVRSITTLQPLPTIDPKDKGKGILVEEEPMKIKRSDQVEMVDEVQARIDTDYELAARMTQEEQEKYTIKERARQQKRIQDFIPMDSKKEVIKDSGKKDDSSSKSAGGSRKKTLARKRTCEKQSKESAKRKKLEDVA
ncbi:hypothetical protein Tco_1256979, partial [Tanacetum coccineum]